MVRPAQGASGDALGKVREGARRWPAPRSSPTWSCGRRWPIPDALAAFGRELDLPEEERAAGAGPGGHRAAARRDWSPTAHAERTVRTPPTAWTPAVATRHRAADHRRARRRPSPRHRSTEFLRPARRRRAGHRSGARSASPGVTTERPGARRPRWPDDGDLDPMPVAAAAARGGRRRAPGRWRWPPTRRWTSPLGEGEEAYGIVAAVRGDGQIRGQGLHRGPRRRLRRPRARSSSASPG